MLENSQNGLSLPADPLPYPAPWLRILLRLPIFGYRLGLGGLLAALHIMVMVPRGRRTGLPRPVAIEFRRHGSKLYVVSAWGDRPQWYRNLCANPEVTVWYGRSQFNGHAQRVTDPAEAMRVLSLFRNRAPFFYDPLLAKLSSRDRVRARDLPDIAHQFTIVRIDRI